MGRAAPDTLLSPNKEFSDNSTKHQQRENNSSSKFYISSLSESGVYVTGIVNHQQTPVLLATGATVSVLKEETWKKSGCYLPSNLQPVEGTLTTASGSQLFVLGKVLVRLYLLVIMVHDQISSKGMAAESFMTWEHLLFTEMKCLFGTKSEILVDHGLCLSSLC